MQLILTDTRTNEQLYDVQLNVQLSQASLASAFSMVHL